LVNILRDYDLDEGPNISQHDTLLVDIVNWAQISRSSIIFQKNTYERKDEKLMKLQNSFLNDKKKIYMCKKSNSLQHIFRCHSIA
jgi:hypothetical protein